MNLLLLQFFLVILVKYFSLFYVKVYENRLILVPEEFLVNFGSIYLLKDIIYKYFSFLNVSRRCLRVESVRGETKDKEGKFVT